MTTPAHDLAEKVKHMPREEAIQYLIEQLSLPGWQKAAVEVLYDRLMSLGKEEPKP